MAKQKKSKRDDTTRQAGPVPITWAGMSLAQLKQVAQQFLRCRNRRLMFGGKYEDALTPEVMCGHLVAELHKFCSKAKLPNLPSQQDLAKRIEVNAGTFGKFLFGLPSGKEPWVNHARKIVKLLLRGENAVTDSDRHAVIDRFTEYFFREVDMYVRDKPAFFQPSRQRFGEPCSRTELAGEIEWLAYEHQYTGRAAKFIWVSGDSTFFPESVTGKVGEAVKLAVECGVRPEFVFQTPSAASRSLDDFLSQNGIAPNGTLRAVDLANLGENPPARWFEFSNPALQFLLLSIAPEEGTRPDETLYIVRGNEPSDDARVRHGAIALEANQTELAAFKAWAARMGL